MVKRKDLSPHQRFLLEHDIPEEDVIQFIKNNGRVCGVKKNCIYWLLHNDMWVKVNIDFQEIVDYGAKNDEEGVFELRKEFLEGEVQFPPGINP